MTKQKFVEEYLMYGIILIMLAAQIIICYNTVVGLTSLSYIGIMCYRDPPPTESKMCYSP